jgi:hypothetical protein
MDIVNNVNNDAMLNELSNDSVEVDNESGVNIDKNGNIDFTERGKIARDCLIKGSKMIIDCKVVGNWLMSVEVHF